MTMIYTLHEPTFELVRLYHVGYGPKKTGRKTPTRPYHAVVNVLRQRQADQLGRQYYVVLHDPTLLDDERTDALGDYIEAIATELCQTKLQHIAPHDIVWVERVDRILWHVSFPDRADNFINPRWTSLPKTNNDALRLTCDRFYDEYSKTAA